MKLPVKVGHSSSYLIASWIDDNYQLNYINIYAYLAPDDLLNQRPFILRLAINKGIGNIALFKRDQFCQGLNQNWHFELTVLPEEILDFLPWIVSLIKAKTKGFTSFAQEPPHPIHLNYSNVLLSEQIWTQKAEQAGLCLK
ncbi:hypothetical protein K9N68_03030 [Kovacikia minuta CCNUW1]|uniref:hypothetical protein n=1 Tax=Kovacikia minuta TaxID=2931930 RepID=UPI001CCA6AE8|nr:hypothetical protein [Kovacikia minuta]UBF26973.1 hypothetical protein K9N68_03030 [Kovacikia minuta CCNUW1]